MHDSIIGERLDHVLPGLTRAEIDRRYFDIQRVCQGIAAHKFQADLATFPHGVAGDGLEADCSVVIHDAYWDRIESGIENCGRRRQFQVDFGVGPDGFVLDGLNDDAGLDVVGFSCSASC